MENRTMAVAIELARVNVTWAGQNGELPDPVAYGASDDTIRGFIAEAVRTGSIPGIAHDERADFADFVIDRFPANERRPFPLIQIRPKTPFG